MIPIVRRLIVLIWGHSRFYRSSPMDPKSLFGRRVRTLRLAKGWSQERLAAEAKLDRTYIGGVERGERNPSLINIFRIAMALRVPMRDLFPDG